MYSAGFWLRLCSDDDICVDVYNFYLRSSVYCAIMAKRPFNGLWSGTTRVGRYQKELSPTHTYPNQRASFIIFLHLQRSMASSLFGLRAWQSSRTTSFQVFFGLPLGLEPSTSCSIHFFTQSSSSFRNTWPYQRSLFCCNTNAMSNIKTNFEVMLIFH